MAEFKLHCFSQSGNAYKAALMLALSGADWEAIHVDFFGGQTRDPNWRQSVNEMGEAPVLEHKGKKFSQSGAILIYLSRLFGKFQPANEDEELEVLRWMFYDNHKFTSYFGTYRFLRSLAPQAPDPNALAFLKGRVDIAFGIVDRHLETQPFIVGSKPTIADVSMAGYMFYPQEEHGYDFAANYPHIHSWTSRLKELPGWVGPYELMPGAPFLAQR